MPSSAGWGRDGHELFYRSDDSVFAVQVRTDPDFAAGQRSLLFTGDHLTNSRHATYDVHPNGQRFVFITGGADDAAELILAQNTLSPVARRSGRSQSHQPRGLGRRLGAARVAVAPRS